MRGIIESKLDFILKGNIVEDVEWFQQEMPISSLGDLALGCVFGALNAYSIGILSFMTNKSVSKKDAKEIETMVKRRLPEISEKISKELNR